MASFELATDPDRPEETDRFIFEGILKMPAPPPPPKVSNVIRSINSVRFISIGQLIDYVNELVLANIYKKAEQENPFVEQIQILCNDKLCKSNYYEEIVSANPNRVLLWPGTSVKKTNVYEDTVAFNRVDAISKGFLGVDEVTDVDGKTQKINNGYPSRIYISLDVIKGIETSFMKSLEEGASKTGFTVKKFLNAISREIALQTGFAVKIKYTPLPKSPVI